MARQCGITGTGVMVGNNVSHAHNKTRRRFLPNIQKMTLYSETLGPVHLKISASTLRSIENMGGLDAYLQKSSRKILTDEALKLRKRIHKSQEKNVR